MAAGVLITVQIKGKLMMWFESVSLVLASTDLKVSVLAEKAVFITIKFNFKVKL